MLLEIHFIFTILLYVFELAQNPADAGSITLNIQSCQTAGGYWLSDRCFIQLPRNYKSWANKRLSCSTYANQTFANADGKLATFPQNRDQYFDLFQFFDFFHSESFTAIGLLQVDSKLWGPFSWVSNTAATFAFDPATNFQFYPDFSTGPDWDNSHYFCGFITGCSSLFVNDDCSSGNGNWSTLCEITNSTTSTFIAVLPSTAPTCTADMQQLCIQYGGVYYMNICYLKNICKPNWDSSGANWEDGMRVCYESSWLLFGNPAFGELAHFTSDALLAVQNYTAYGTNKLWIGLNTACVNDYKNAYWYKTLNYVDGYNYVPQESYSWTGSPPCNDTENKCFFINDWSTPTTDVNWVNTDCTINEYANQPMYSFCAFSCSIPPTLKENCTALSNNQCQKVYAYTTTTSQMATTSTTSAMATTSTTSTMATTSTTSKMATTSTTSAMATTSTTSKMATTSTTSAMATTATSTMAPTSDASKIATTSTTSQIDTTSKKMEMSTSSSTIQLPTTSTTNNTPPPPLSTTITNKDTISSPFAAITTSITSPANIDSTMQPTSQRLNTIETETFLPLTSFSNLWNQQETPTTQQNIVTLKNELSTVSVEEVGNYSIVVAVGIPTSLYDKITTSSIVQDTIPYLTAPLPDSVKRKIGYQYSDIISNCSFSGSPCGEQNFHQTVDATYGNCYTFNYGLQPKLSSQPGSPYGLRVILKTPQSDYLCSTESAGFIIVLNDNNETAYPDTHGYKIAPGTDNFISVDKSIFIQAGGRYSKCLQINEAPSYFDQPYSTEGCYRHCFQTFMKKICGCVDPRYNSLKGSTYCTVDEKLCLDYTRSCEANLTKESCGCHELCRNVAFPTRLSNSHIINDIYMSFTYDNGMNNSSVENEQVSILNVFYGSIQSIEYTEIPGYDMEDFLSDVSNVLGVLIGFCMITLFELAIIIVYAVPAVISSITSCMKR